MDIHFYFALIPYAGSFLISFVIGLEAWQREDWSARAYTGVALSQSLWTFGYIFELISPDLAGKIFWDNVQFIGGVGWSLTFLIFALHYTQRRFARPFFTYLLLALPGIIIVLLAFTDPLHQLVRPTAYLVPGRPFSALLYDISPTFWAWAIFSYGLGVACVGLLFIKFLHTQPLYRFQVGLIVVGNAIPVIGTFMTMFGLITIPLRDITPLTFPLGNIFVAFGLFQYRLFDVKPIAYDIIIENMRDAVFVIDKNRRIVDLNQAAVNAVPTKQDKLVGQTIDEALADWPNLLAQYPSLVEQGHVEVSVPMPNGIHIVELTIQPLTSRRGRKLGEVVIARDVTKQKTAVAALKQRTAELEQANQQLLTMSQVKDQFVSNVSHELRTPITSLKLHQTLIKRNPTKRTTYLDVMERETNRLGNLIEDILTLSRFDQNPRAIRFKPVDLVLLIRNFIQDRAQLAAQKQITLQFSEPEKVPSLSGHKNLIEQSVGILLVNALNYTPPEGKVCLNLTVTLLEGEQWACITVQDNGPGISLADQQKLFTRFYRGAAGQNSGVPGTGLGLVIAKEIIARHNGRLHIQSSGIPGEGTTATILLPFSQSTPSRNGKHPHN